MTQTSEELPEEPPLADETLFGELMKLFGESADGAVRRAFDEGVIDRDALADRVAHRYAEVTKWLAAARWFAEEYDNDLDREEWDVTVDGATFASEQFYRSNFVEFVVRWHREVQTAHEWRDMPGGDQRAFVYVVEGDDE